MKKRITKYLRKRGIITKPQEDLMFGFGGGYIDSLVDIIYDFANAEVNGVKSSQEKALHKHIVTCRYFIYVFYQVGNIGSRDVKTIDEQPKNGFETEQEAEQHLKKLILTKKGYFFDRDWYKFTIMKTWNSLSAV